jgi:fructokinase
MPDKPQVIALGEILIDFIALDAGKSEDVSGFLKMPGGAPANFCVALARLGASVGMVTKVGNDPFGRFLTGVLKKEGVDTGQVKFCNAKTGIAFVFLSKEGERSFLFYRDGTSDFMLSPRDINANYFSNAGIFHFSSAMLMSKLTSEALFKAIKIAKKKSVKVSFDPNLRKGHPLPEDRLARALHETDYLLLTDDEAKELTGIRDGRKAAEALLENAEIVALKMGAKGSYLTDGNEHVYAKPFRVKPVDTTGAGDGYDAGFVYGMLKGWGLKRTGTFANAVGALVTTKKGAMTALPTKKEVYEFIRNSEK